MLAFGCGYAHPNESPESLDLIKQLTNSKIHT